MKPMGWKAPARFACAVLVAWPLACADWPRDARPSVDWTHPGADSDETGFAALEQITPHNAERLGLAWFLDLPGEASLEATPLAVDGVLYFTGSYADVYAVDGVTGELLWKYEPLTWQKLPERMVGSLPVNRGVAYARGRLFVGALDGRLIALDARSGRELWSTQTVADGEPNRITGAPRTFGDKVIIGNGGAELGARGYVTALDQATGEIAWRFFVVPGSPEQNAGNPALELAAKTWSGEFWRRGTGGTVWNGITFDAELNRLYLGTGNSAFYDPELRSPGGGDNLFLASIVALDADTGEYVWHYQVNPREAWDYKACMNMILATLEIAGEPRKVLMQAPTNGFFYVIDRETGKLISAEKIGKVSWAERIDLETGRPVERPGIRYEDGQTLIFPGPLGAHNFQPMSFSPVTGLVYIPYQQLGGLWTKDDPDAGLSIAGLSLTNVAVDPEDGTGALLAWDPVRQEARWKVPHEHFWNGGTAVTAGGVVFQGTADGHFSAYDASTGQRLWRFDAGQGIIAAPVSYAVDGVQYVSILAGYGATAAVSSDFLDVGWTYRQHERRLLTFELGGRARLPASPPPDPGVRALDVPGLVLADSDVEAGRTLYAKFCSQCHGLDARGAGGPGPDLRESPLALEWEAFRTVVRDSTLLSRGMRPVDHLDDAQTAQVYAYVRAKAREALGLRAPGQP